jgi:hypothetical protein
MEFFFLMLRAFSTSPFGYFFLAMVRIRGSGWNHMTSLKEDIYDYNHERPYITCDLLLSFVLFKLADSG